MLLLRLSNRTCGSVSDSFDVVVTDPPFGGLLHYSELSDFFYVWLRLALQEDTLTCLGRNTSESIGGCRQQSTSPR